MHAFHTFWFLEWFYKTNCFSFQASTTASPFVSKASDEKKQKPDTDGASALTASREPLHFIPSPNKGWRHMHDWKRPWPARPPSQVVGPHSSAIAVMYARWPQWFFRPHTAEESRKLTSSCVSCTAAWCSLYLDRTTRSTVPNTPYDSCGPALYTWLCPTERIISLPWEGGQPICQ